MPRVLGEAPEVYGPSPQHRYARVRVPIHSPAGENTAGRKHFLPAGLAAARRRRVAQVERALNNAVRPVKGSRIALLGISYKPGVGYIRESPALKILTLLSGPRSARSCATTTRTYPHSPTTGYRASRRRRRCKTQTSHRSSPHTPVSTTTRCSRAHASS
jgi:hypothetical protein